MRKVTVFTLTLVLLMLTVAHKADAAKCTVINNSLFQLDVVHASWMNADGKYPEGFRVKGWFHIAPGKQRTFTAQNAIYVRVAPGDPDSRPFKPANSTQDEAYSFQTEAYTQSLSKRDLFTTVETSEGEVIYSSINRALLVRSDGFYEFTDNGTFKVSGDGRDARDRAINRAIERKVEKEAFSPCFSVDLDSSTPRPPNKRADNQLIAEAVIMKNWLWTHETTVTVETDKTLILKVRFLDGRSSERARVKRVAPEWSKHADIRFEFVDSGPSDIRIGFDPNDGHWSYIGRAAISKTKTMNLASGHTDRVILHEFGHALGLKHEHQNPAVSIRWNEQAVLAEYRKRQKWSDDKIRRNVLNRLNVDQTNFTEFDPASIMLYAIPNRWTIGDFETGYNRELSATDKRFIGEQYGRPAQSSGMVLIPAGEFQMGGSAPQLWNNDEKPVHPVYVDAFYMDKYEVTVGQYKQFLRATGHRALPNYLFKYSTTDRHPVTGVSWHDAMAYAAWAGKRLPTEAEWEKAARGGLVGQKYPWGNAIDPSKANYNKHVGKTTPVGRYAPNGYGLYDMAGNAYEWCLDEYDRDFYGRSPRSNPIAGGTITSIIHNFTNVKTRRVVRGGSWGASAPRVAVRGGNGPMNVDAHSGFRCARDQ